MWYKNDRDDLFVFKSLESMLDELGGMYNTVTKTSAEQKAVPELDELRKKYDALKIYVTALEKSQASLKEELKRVQGIDNSITQPIKTVLEKVVSILQELLKRL